MLACLCMTAAGFVSGSVMYSYIIPRLFYRIDVREKSEDGNPGSMNAIEAAGKGAGLVCMALDLLKAFAPVYVSAVYLRLSGYYLIPVMLAPVMGHAFSPFMRFRGGKAVASSFGSLLGAATVSRAVFILAASMALFQFVVRVSPNSAKVIASCALTFALIILMEPRLEIKLASSLIILVMCYKHYVNPNKDEFNVRIGRYIINYDNKRLKFAKKDRV